MMVATGVIITMLFVSRVVARERAIIHNPRSLFTSRPIEMPQMRERR